MMGGLGSGRPAGFGRDKVETCRSIDVNKLHREGCLKSGWRGGLQWSQDGEKVASVNLRAEDDFLHLSFRSRISGGEWEDVEEAVLIARVACQYGGSRPYFICPGLVNGITCGRRVVKLHGPGRYFLCRHCYQLTYTSQSEEGWDRALRRANKIRKRLGGDPGIATPFPERPKGMWKRTYERFLRESKGIETEACEGFFAFSKRLRSHLNKTKQKRSFWP
jgi:hypothetical protein